MIPVFCLFFCPFFLLQFKEACRTTSTDCCTRRTLRVILYILRSICAAVFTYVFDSNFCTCGKTCMIRACTLMIRTSTSKLLIELRYVFVSETCTWLQAGASQGAYVSYGSSFFFFDFFLWGSRISYFIFESCKIVRSGPVPVSCVVVL